MSQKEVFDDLRKALGKGFEFASDESMDRLTEGTWIRLQFQFINLIRECLRLICKTWNMIWILIRKQYE